MSVHIKENINKIPCAIKDFFINNNLHYIENSLTFDSIEEKVVIAIFNLTHLNDAKHAPKYAKELLKYGGSYIYTFCIINENNFELRDYLRNFYIPGKDWLQICPISEGKIAEIFDPTKNDAKRRTIAERLRTIESHIENTNDIFQKNIIRMKNFEAFQNDINLRHEK